MIDSIQSITRQPEPLSLGQWLYKVFLVVDDSDEGDLGDLNYEVENVSGF
jgi:hypothetical protein